jgi:hypothetical protein
VEDPSARKGVYDVTEPAVAKYTIIRFEPMRFGYWRDWKPVGASRWRFFEDATHEAVTGERGGAHWTNHWSCETFDAGDKRWHILGRNTWPTYDVALQAVSSNTFATFEEALVEARNSALIVRSALQKRLAENQFGLDIINSAQPLVLP